MARHELNQKSQAGTLAIGDRWPLALKIYPQLKQWRPEDIQDNQARLDELEDHLNNCPARHADPFTLEVNKEPNVYGGRYYRDDHRIYVPSRVSYGYLEDESCPYIERARQLQILFDNAKFPRRFSGWRLKDIAESEAKQQVLAYVEQFPEHKKAGRGFLLVGGTGTGKTTLAVAAGIELIKRHKASVYFITCHDLLEFSRDFKNTNGLEKWHMVESDVLIIDDIGTDRLTDFGLSELTAFLDKCYRELKPMIITTNLGRADMTEYLGERTISRINECCEIVKLIGEDRRQARS